jgi:hypothetical protein
MTSSQEADEHTIHHIPLADDDFSDFFPNPIQLLGGELQSSVRLHAIHDSAAFTAGSLC